MKAMKAKIALASIICVAAAALADLPDAATLISNVQLRIDAPAPAGGPSLRELYEEYQSLPPDAPPGREAECWLALLDKLLERSGAQGMDLYDDSDACGYTFRNDSPLPMLLERVPSAEAWPSVREGLAARASAKGATNAPPLVAAAQFIFDRLAHDDAAVSNSLERLRAAATGSKNAVRAFRKLERGLGPKGVPTRGVEQYFQGLAHGYGHGRCHIGIPSDLLDVPPERLWELTAQVFTNDASRIYLYWAGGRDGATHKALLAVALAHAGELAAPVGFALVDHTPDGRELYDALLGRFDFMAKPPVEDDIPFREATLKVVRGILARDGIDAAVVFASRFPKYFFRNAKVRFTDGGAAEMDFLERYVLADNSDSYLLKIYADTARKCGKTARAREWLSSFGGDIPLRVAAKGECLGLAAFDDDEDAIAALSREIRESLPDCLRGRDINYECVGVIERAMGLLAAISNKVELAAFADAILSAAIDAGVKRGCLSTGISRELVSALGEVGLDDKALDAAVELLVTDSGPAGGFHDTVLPLYRKAGRHLDIVRIVEGDPCFVATNALQLLESGSMDLLEIYAEALAEVGRWADAVAIAREVALVWHRHRDCGDWPFRILAGYMDNHAEFDALMGALAEADKFEERPLVWMAEALRRAGCLDEAEPLARRAVEIDPTDGETRDGDRIRSYSVLADILAERGDAKGAEFLRNAVRAVRLAEEGDFLDGVGLTRRSLAKYEEAEKFFSAAYCVQWRKAERLRELGLADAAARHYEETFRQLPTQFGFVASLCFGCAGVFDSPGAIPIAEKILTEAASGGAPAPAACYLLGKLREEQGRNEEAFEAYGRATALAPDYLDAYVAQCHLRFRVHRPLGVWEGIQARVFELDPLGRHSLGLDSQIIDWGLEKRLESKALRKLPAQDLGRLRRIVFPASAARAVTAGAPKKSDYDDEYDYTSRLTGSGMSAHAMDGRSLADSEIVRDLSSLVRELGDRVGYMFSVGDDSDIVIPDEFLY